MNEDLWIEVYASGEQVDADSGFGAEAGWTFYERELEKFGLLWRATQYSSEARLTRNLYVYSDKTELWIVVGETNEAN